MGRRISENSKKLYTQVFTESGTWVKPATVTEVTVKIVGGGGGGGNLGSYMTGSSGAGGGGSGGVQIFAVPVTDNVTVTVGAGGAENSPGSASSFGASYVAAGGRPGRANTEMEGGAGGSAGLGGSNGQPGASDSERGGAGGGGTDGGAGGYGTNDQKLGGNARANTGAGGGGGAGWGNSGGSGGSGVVHVTWWDW